MDLALLSKLASPGARQQVEQKLRCALKKSHEEDIKYIPHINEQYPSPLRRHAASLFCTAGFLPRQEHSTQDVSIDIPDGILDDAPLAVLLGGVAWFAACLGSRGKGGSDDAHDQVWHDTFFQIFCNDFESFIDYALPKLPAQVSNFCIGLYFDCHYLNALSRSKEWKPMIKIFAAVAIFLRNKNVLLQCCRRCQILYTQLFSDTTLSTSINELPMNTDQSGIPSRSTSAELY